MFVRKFMVSLSCVTAMMDLEVALGCTDRFRCLFATSASHIILSRGVTLLGNKSRYVGGTALLSIAVFSWALVLALTLTLFAAFFLLFLLRCTSVKPS